MGEMVAFGGCSDCARLDHEKLEVHSLRSSEICWNVGCALAILTVQLLDVIEQRMV